MSILAAIVALCVVIIIHEAGHYLAAVWTGMKVDRFSVFGIGPTVLKLGTWRGTEFVISAIPFGAFVLIRGMEPNDEGEIPGGPEGDAIDDDAWAKAMAGSRSDEAIKAARAASPNFRDKPLWARASGLAGGPLANYLTAMLLFFGLFAVAGVAGPPTHIEITQVNQDEPAAAAGLLPGDHITAIGDVAVVPTNGSQGVIDVLKASPGKSLPVTVIRDGQTVVTTVTPSEKGTVGMGLDPRGPRVSVSTGTAAAMAIERPIEITKAQLVGLYKLATFQLDGKVEGPVGIVKQIKASVERGLIAFVGMSALISTLLGMFNLLPLPALDGGRLSFLLYEAIARRRARPHVEEMVHGYGMLALLVLIAVVTLGDIRSFF